MPRISRLLVANRGEIARRIFRTCREMGIGTVAVYAEPDRHSPFVREADIAIALDGTTSAETYLNIFKVVSAARRAGADAIHPGYGFLSENAEFARAVIDAGLTWVGPHIEAIAAMGDKLTAKRRLALAGVPMLPSVDCTGLSASELAAKAIEIGYPVLVKASGGGGGRGMRVVKDEAGLTSAVTGAKREAKSAFGNDTVFLERYLELSRHVEVQVFGDKHGNVAHCFERECSIQRRHQKIIEEAPSPAVDPDLRRRMGEAAVAAAFAIGYDNAGTVEFLLDEPGTFYFLEMNTRLQVEHPVTEAITGLDLVREQIRVAEGHELSFTQEELRINGHAIEARLYAEDPEKNFFPVSGRVERFEPDPRTTIRVDSGVESGSEVSIYFDPMLAKLIAHGPTREEAALRLAGAMERLRVPGVTTNRDFLANTLHHPGFLAGDTTTAFIETHAPARRRVVPPQELAFALLAAALHGAEKRKAVQKVLTTLPSGWRNNRSAPETVSYEFQGETIAVGYAAERDGRLRCSVGETAHLVRKVELAGEHVTLEVDEVARTGVVTREGDRVWVQTSAGEVSLRELPRFPEATLQTLAGGYTAPMPGKVISVHVATGKAVKAGDLLLILEAMKMEHRITAAADGRVAELRVAEGAQVEAGQVLLVMEGG
ncbi:MAG: acetyl/propionyl-CoA carboxylase subunit alpha [Anaerolinea sp.]|nr:acetyl/propionyl-CoA carboxylase subunit alpha [Anaerolinea sp.]